MCVTRGASDMQGQRIEMPLGDWVREHTTEIEHTANLVGRRTGFFPVIGSGKGFKLNDELLLLASTLSIYSFWFTCK